MSESRLCEHGCAYGCYECHMEVRAAIRAAMPRRDDRIAHCDPGIRDTVRTLRAAGFETTDSGDGVSKADWIASGEALPFAHVFAVTTRDVMLTEADRMQTLLGPRWYVEASYGASDGKCLLLARENIDGQ